MNNASWFDAGQVDPSQSVQKWPLGRHPVVIKSGIWEGSKNNEQSGMLTWTLEIIDGPNKGFSGPYRLNLKNVNPQSVEIAQKQLSAVCHVIGIQHVVGQHCESHFGKPFCVQVDPQTGPNADKGYTQITAVFDMQGNPPLAGKFGAGAAPQQTMQQPPMQQPHAQPQQPAQQGWQGQAPQPGPTGPGGAPQWGAPAQQQPHAQPQQPAQQGWQAGAPAGGAPSWASPPR